MSSLKTASLEELRAMKARGEVVATRSGAESVEMPEGFWDEADLVMPVKKKQVNLRVDQDVFDFFKSQGSGHLTRMHAVLRTYVDAQRNVL